LGDFVKNPLVGAVYFSFGNYRIQPQDPPSVRFVPQNARPAEPTTYGNLVVASANVLNYWTTLGGRGADTPEQLAVQTEKLVAELRGTGADIIGLQEVENDPTHTPILTLVDALNAAAGSDVWSWIGEHEANVYPIRNEIVYRNDRVEPVGDPVTVVDPIFDTIPPGRDDPIGRRPVAQTFIFDGETFTVVNNHFKSKGCGGASGADEDQNDGQSCFNATRMGQAERVLELVDDLIAMTGDLDVIVIGDLNAYLDEDPILVFETEMVNLVRRRLRSAVDRARTVGLCPRHSVDGGPGQADRDLAYQRRRASIPRLVRRLYGRPWSLPGLGSRSGDRKPETQMMIPSPEVISGAHLGGRPSSTLSFRASQAIYIREMATEMRRRRALRTYRRPRPPRS
jgi:hypothetical protein